MTPQRIQRKRVKGWRMPKGAVYVGRPSKWSNPHVVTSDVILDVPTLGYRQTFTGQTAGQAVEKYRDMIVNRRRAYVHVEPPTIDDTRAALSGRDLACWCPLDQPCHADVLLEIANREAR